MCLYSLDNHLVGVTCDHSGINIYATTVGYNEGIDLVCNVCTPGGVWDNSTCATAQTCHL